MHFFDYRLFDKVKRNLGYDPKYPDQKSFMRNLKGLTITKDGIMKRMTFAKIVIVIAVLSLCSCLDKQAAGDIEAENRQLHELYEMKGYNEMKQKKKRLKPQIITSGKRFLGMAEVSIENSIATIDNSGSFALMEFDEKGEFELKPIVEGFPGSTGELYSDSEHNVLWSIRGRGVYFLEIESRKTGHVIASNDGNAKIRQVLLLDPEKKLFMVTSGAVGCATRFCIYDLVNDSYKEVGYDLAMIFRFYDNKIIGYYYGKDNGVPYFDWVISDFEMKNFEGPKSNKLTKELSKLRIKIWKKTKTIHAGRRMMLGTSLLNDILTYYSIRWNEEMDEVKVEPIILQQPANSTLHSDFVFSANGQWVKTLYTTKKGGPKLTELIIYHTGSVYPQGLSMPIYCGYTKEGNDGAFMQHDQWGPVYVENDQDMTDKLFIYKLNDGLEILKEQALDIVPGGSKP